MKKLALIFLLLSSIGWAAPVHTCRAATTGASTGQNCTLSSVSTNSLLVVMQSLKRGSLATGVTATDTFGLTWKMACGTDYQSVNGNDSQLTILYANSAGHSGNDTITTAFTSSGAGETLYAAEYALNYTFDPNACMSKLRNAASGALTTDAMTVLDDNELLITVGGATGTPANLTLNDANFTLEDSQSTTVPRWADRLLGSSTAGTTFTTSWTDSASVDMGIVLAAFTSVTHSSSALVQSAGQGVPASATTTRVKAFPSSVSGNHLLLAIYESQQSLTPAITDTLGLSWSSISKNWNGTGNKLTVFYAVTGASSGAETITVTTASSASIGPLHIAEYGGTHPWNGTVLDVHAENNATVTVGTNYSSGNATTTGNSDLLISVGGVTNQGSDGYMTIDTSWLREGYDPDSIPSTVQWGDKIAGAAGTYSAVWLPNGGSGGLSMIVAFGPGHPASSRKVHAQTY
jgi:hypothetical protein